MHFGHSSVGSGERKILMYLAINIGNRHLFESTIATISCYRESAVISGVELLISAPPHAFRAFTFKRRALACFVAVSATVGPPRRWVPCQLDCPLPAHRG